MMTYEAVCRQCEWVFAEHTKRIVPGMPAACTKCGAGMRVQEKQHVEPLKDRTYEIVVQDKQTGSPRTESFLLTADDRTTLDPKALQKLYVRKATEAFARIVTDEKHLYAVTKKD